MVVGGAFPPSGCSAHRRGANVLIRAQKRAVPRVGVARLNASALRGVAMTTCAGNAVNVTGARRKQLHSRRTAAPWAAAGSERLASAMATPAMPPPPPPPGGPPILQGGGPGKKPAAAAPAGGGAKSGEERLKEMEAEMAL